jgi:hypothetical protein
MAAINGHHATRTSLQPDARPTLINDSQGTGFVYSGCEATYESRAFSAFSLREISCFLQLGPSWFTFHQPPIISPLGSAQPERSFLPAF